MELKDNERRVLPRLELSLAAFSDGTSTPWVVEMIARDGGKKASASAPARPAQGV